MESDRNTSCPPRASAETIDALFGSRLLCTREATRAAVPTASPIFNPGFYPSY